MILWLTDTHLDFLKRPDAAYHFGKYMLRENPQAESMIITGDISTAKNISNHLTQLADGFTKPIYFVLGNHDYYGSSFDEVDKEIEKLCRSDGRLTWLNKKSLYIDGVHIVGASGWYDRRLGNPNPKFIMMDYSEIKDFEYIAGIENLLLDSIRAKADFEAEVLRRNMIIAAQRADTKEEWSDTIIVCTHVPPYAKSSWHRGGISDWESLGCFSSSISGNLIDHISMKYSHKNFIVLCGHGHSPGVYEHSSNVTVFTGRAKYGDPNITGRVYTKERKIKAYDNAGKRVERAFDQSPKLVDE